MIPCSAFTDAFACSSLGTNVCTHVLTLLKHSLDKKKKEKKRKCIADGFSSGKDLSD